MLSKLLVIIIGFFLLLTPAFQSIDKATPQPEQPLAKPAAITACIGPMNVQLFPKDQGPALVTFATGGCSPSSSYGFGLQFGKVATPPYPVKINTDSGAVRRF